MSRHRREVPVAPWYAAEITGAMHEDCGPCVQLVVRMAEEAGVEATTLVSVVQHDERSCARVVIGATPVATFRTSPP